MANDKFLDAYRSLETELKLEGCGVLDYENTLTDKTTQERLKVCRIMRNYMAHNDTTFLCSSTDQIRFLEQMASEIRKKAHTVKDEMKRVKALKASAPIKEVIASLDKYPIAVLESKAGFYLVDKDILVHQLALGNKKVEIPARLPKYRYTTKDCRMEDLGRGIYVVTADGTEKGAYLGILMV